MHLAFVIHYNCLLSFYITPLRWLKIFRNKVRSRSRCGNPARATLQLSILKMNSLCVCSWTQLLLAPHQTTSRTCYILCQNVRLEGTPIGHEQRHGRATLSAQVRRTCIQHRRPESVDQYSCRSVRHTEHCYVQKEPENIFIPWILFVVLT